MKERKASYNHPTKGYPIVENIFDGVLYCGVCGRKMTRSSYVQHYADGENRRCLLIVESDYLLWDVEFEYGG